MSQSLFSHHGVRFHVTGFLRHGVGLMSEFVFTSRSSILRHWNFTSRSCLYVTEFVFHVTGKDFPSLAFPSRSWFYVKELLFTSWSSILRHWIFTSRCSRLYVRLSFHVTECGFTSPAFTSRSWLHVTELVMSRS